MSKQNKVNPGQYHVAGRLTPDEAARERMKQHRPAATAPPPRAGQPAPARTPPAGQRAQAAPHGAKKARAAGRKSPGEKGHGQ